jgi:hypothetical protein
MMNVDLFLMYKQITERVINQLSSMIKQITEIRIKQ